ncbi:hypothetical protein EV383_0307 [Pseudonocardia sediminis]|uniref:Uncharacterized protein n=1 Tax=Pseudonocardia sediminis TaxID=1397368 RepID=A0A4Q7UP62_PSEST|nr:hypothetical protein [Pseudonocardia sediminis]RZT83502.1 hypothetical protein EV383_0307 [Pseudonocardia sediminis]
MTTVLIALAGIALLVWFAVLIGTAMDTEGQRREWQRLAEQRRLLREERGASTFVARRCDPESLCAECPFR